MRILLAFVATIAISSTARADHYRYGDHFTGAKEIKVYGYKNGFKDTLSGPKAIIEVDPYEDTAKVYKSDIFGGKDILSGPIAEIEIEREPRKNYLFFGDDCPHDDSVGMRISRERNW